MTRYALLITLWMLVNAGPGLSSEPAANGLEKVSIMALGLE